MEPKSVQAYLPIVYNILSGNKHLTIEEKKAPSVLCYNAEIKSSQNDGSFAAKTEKSVAVIPIKGAIMKYDTLCEYGMESVSQWLENALQNDSIVAVVIDFDSGGGSPDAVNRISSVIKNAKKPVLGYVGNGIAASACYWIASNCKEIFATFEMDEVGSIGAFATLMDFNEYMRSQGLPVTEIYATDSTEKNKEIRDLFENGNEDGIRTQLVDPLNKMFQATIKKNRAGKLNLKDYPQVMMGKLYKAKDALNAGLIDGIMSREAVISRAFELANNSKPNNNSTKTSIDMKKFEKTAALLKVDSFEKTAEGVHLSEDQLEIVETAIAAKETAEAANVTALATIKKHETDLATATATNGVQAKKIEELSTEIVKLGGEHPGVKGAAVKTGTEGEEVKVDTEKYPSFKSTENNPLFQ